MSLAQKKTKTRKTGFWSFVIIILLFLVSDPLESVVNVVALLFFCEAVLRVDDLAVLPLAILNVLSCTHYGNVELSSSCANVIPVNEVNVSELTAIRNAVLDGHCFAAAEEYGTEVTVCVHRRVVAGLVNKTAVFCVNRAGVTILMLFSKVRSELAHNVEEVMLEIFELERVNIM